MVTEWLIQVGTNIATWFLGLVPADKAGAPAQVSQFDDMVNSFMSGFGSLGVWVPWAVVIVCAGLSVGIWIVLWGIKGIAWIWGQVPVIGGAG